jgi:hypothetical protein
MQFQALGRSRGGFTTKVHLRCNAVGLPVGVVLTPGETHDVTAYDALMQQRDSDPGAMLADKGLSTGPSTEWRDTVSFDTLLKGVGRAIGRARICRPHRC